MTRPQNTVGCPRYSPAHLLPWLLFAVGVGVPLACLWRYGPAAVPGIARSDFEYYFLPQREFLHRWLARGVFPFWNPHLFCGYPTVEVIQSSLFYPFNSLVIALAPARAGMLAFLSAHIVLAAALAWVSFRRILGVGNLAAVAGALVCLNGAVFPLRFLAGHPIIIYAMAWMPLALCALMRALRECAESGGDDAVRGWRAFVPPQRAWRWIAVSAVACACMVLSGAPQYAFYLLWACAAVAAASPGVPWRVRVMVFLTVWLLAAAISAPQWLPTLAYLPYANRGGGTYRVRTTPATLVVAALEFFLRRPLGDGLGRPHLNDRGIWETCAYCGIAAPALAVAALLSFRSAAWPLRLVLAQTAGILALALWHIAGAPLPGFGFFRETLRGLVLVQIAAGLLVAVGFDLLSDRAHGKTVRHGLAFGAALLACIAAFGAALAVVAPGTIARFLTWTGELTETTLVHHAVKERLAQIARNPGEIAGPFAVSAATGTLLAGIALACALAARRHPRAALAALATLLVLDPLGGNWRYYLTCVRPLDTGWPAETRDDLARLAAPALAGTAMPWRATVPESMTNAAQLIEGVAEPRGYDPAAPHQAIARTVAFSREMPHAERVALKAGATATRVEVAEEPEGVPETVPQRARRFRLHHSWPDSALANLATSVSVTSDPWDFGPVDGTGHLALFPVGTDDPAPWSAGALLRTLLPSHAAHWRGALPPPCDAVTTAGLDVRHIPQPSPNRMVFEARLDRPAVLVVRSTWLPGWTCTINGKPRGRPLCMNSWMIGVPLQPGSHTVRLQYRPVGLTPSLMLSAAGLAACIALWLARRKRGAR